MVRRVEVASAIRILGRRLLVLALVGVLGGGLALAARPARTAAPPGTGITPSPVPVTLPLHASIVSRSTAGSVLTLTIACRRGGASDVCSGPITLTASGSKAVGSASYSTATGTQTTVTVPLNATGLSLLAATYKLPATLTVAGTTALTRAVHFHYARITSPVLFTWVFGPRSTRMQLLTVKQLPTGATVEVICAGAGGGCPFASHDFSPTGSTLALAPWFPDRLTPHTKLELEITDTNQVGKVATFVILNGSQPVLTVRCLPPGATSPTTCA